MVVWTRWGILSLFLLGGVVALVIGGATALGMADQGKSNTASIGIGLIAAALVHGLYVTFLQARFMDRPRPLIVVQDVPVDLLVEAGSGDIPANDSRAGWGRRGRGQQAKTAPVAVPAVDDWGRTIYEYPRSSLFFVPVEYLTQLVGVIGIVVFALNAAGVLA